MRTPLVKTRRIMAAGAALLLAACDGTEEGAGRARLHLPPADFRPDIKTGERLFIANCARCHGRRGDGAEQGPPLVHETYRPGHHADLTFHWAVRDGARQHHWHFGDMPAVPNLTPEDVGHIIAFIRKRQRDAGIE